MKRISFTLAIVASCVLAGGGTPARGDVTTAIYDDVKSIIEELITDEVSQSIVPNVVCFANREKRTASDPDSTIVKIDGTEYRLDALFFFPQSLQHVYAAEFGALRSSLRDEAADMAGYALYRRLSTPDPSALSNTVQQFAGQRGDQAKEQALVKAYDDKPIEESCTDAVGKKFKTGQFATPGISALDGVCASPADGRETFYCELAVALRSTLQGNPGIAEDHLIQAVAAFVTDVIMKQLDTTDSDTRKRIDELVVLGLRDLLGKGSAPDKFVADLTTALSALTSPDDKPLFKPEAIRGAAAAIRQALVRIRTQWQVAREGGTQSVDVATFISALTLAGGGLDLLCKLKITDGLCEKDSFAALAKLLREGKALWPVIRAAAHGDLTEAARATVHTMFVASEGSECSSEPFGLSGTCKKTAFQSFLEALVEYVFETINDKQPSDATRAAFRSAAITAIRTMDVGGGFNRPGWHLGGCSTHWYCSIPRPGASWVIPDLGLRASWSPGYVNDSGHTLRYVASASLLTSRIVFRYTEQAYMALHLSAVDPLSPLSELAVRNSTNTTYSRSGMLAWNLITPRAEMAYGAPFLSKKLVVTAGFSLRLVSPFPDPVDRTHYTYVGIDLHGDFDQWSRFLEFGVAVKYIP